MDKLVDSFHRVSLVVFLDEWTQYFSDKFCEVGRCLRRSNPEAFKDSLGHGQPSLVGISPGVGEKYISKLRNRPRYWGLHHFCKMISGHHPYQCPLWGLVVGCVVGGRICCWW